jgi:hypothetical protein
MINQERCVLDTYVSEKEKIYFEISRLKWEDNIKIDTKGMNGNALIIWLWIGTKSGIFKKEIQCPFTPIK